MAARALFDLKEKAWLDRAKFVTRPRVSSPIIVVSGAKNPAAELREILDRFGVSRWQVDALKSSSVAPVAGEKGPIAVVDIKQSSAHPFGAARDLVGRAAATLLASNPSTLGIHFLAPSPEETQGALVGVEMAGYSYRRVRGRQALPELSLSGLGKKLDGQHRRAAQLGHAINVARHLVNVPGGELNPKSYAQSLQTWFKDSVIKVAVWSESRLKQENMGLLQAVGHSAKEKACLVHLRYRPRGSVSKAPIAFVGKGITFDSGGLNLKPASGMRLMKKDMGGSAVLVGVAQWLREAKPPQACDIYLAIAENAIDGESVRPGDVMRARNGLTVEMHNTDAEGRLALADCLDVAITQKPKPRFVIDCATLTGASRVALGTKVAALFSNDDALASLLIKASEQMDDPCWRMPLVPSYFDTMKSTVADFTNSSTSRYGGAITAALFLQKFVGDAKWAHFDVMAWADSSRDACSESGGNGHLVQTLCRFVEDIE